MNLSDYSEGDRVLIEYVSRTTGNSQRLTGDVEGTAPGVLWINGDEPRASVMLSDSGKLTVANGDDSGTRLLSYDADVTPL